MKFNTKFLVFSFLLVGLLLVSTVDAKCSGYQAKDKHNDWNEFSDDGIIFVFSDFKAKDRTYLVENEDRYPTYNYRNGFSYRASGDYYYDAYSRGKVVSYNDDIYYERNTNDYYYQEKPSYYYVQNDYMDKYEKHECYNYPPKGKLVYTKCP